VKQLLGAATTVRLGRGGPELRLTIPAIANKGGTREVQPKDIVDRYLADDAPEDMSSHTRMIRAAVQERREQETNSWLQRLRRLRVAIGILVVLSAGAGGVAVWQARRVNALRAAAGAVFNTMKSLELDVRRLEAASGPDSSIQERRGRLEAQYQDLVKTLGIYSDRTPADVRSSPDLHPPGRVRTTIPKGFVVKSVSTSSSGRRWIWAGLARASAWFGTGGVYTC
jgi:hypothetical protein